MAELRCARWLMVGTLIAATDVPMDAQLIPLDDEFQVSVTTLGDQQRPRVAVAPSGRFVVVWVDRQQAGPTWQVRRRRYAATGLPVSGELSLSLNPGLREEGANIAAFPDGTMVGAWHGVPGDDDGFAVLARQLEVPGIHVDGDLLANTYTTSNQDYPDAAAAPDGSFFLVWSSFGQDGDQQGVYGGRFGFVEGGLTTEEFQISTYTAGRQQWPRVARLPDGHVVAWESSDGQDGDGAGIFAQRFDSAGAPQGGEFQVNTYTVGDQLLPALAAGPDGTTLITWYGPGAGGGDEVWLRWYTPAGEALGGEVAASAIFAGNRQRPAAAAFDAGFIVAWDAALFIGDSFDVKARLFDPAGTPASDEFLVNTYTMQNQIDPAVAASGNGFVVVWESFGQDGDRLGVFGQRFVVRPTETPTLTATVSSTPTPQASPTATATPAPTASGSPPASPTAAMCPGDCDGDGVVRIDELVRAVSIALDALPLDQCPAADRGGDGSVSIDDLVAAVNAALSACA